MYCWPNFKDHPDFAVDKIPRSDVLSSAMEVSAEFGETLSFAEIDEEANRQGVSIWPMIIFEGDKAMNRFHALAMMDETQEYVDSDEGHTDASDQEPGTDLDEYESDGIDDDDINEYSSGDDDEDDLAVLPMSDDLSTAGDFSPSGEHAIEGADAGLNAYPQAQFSSPEAESDTARDIDSSESDEAPARAPKRRKRRAVASSSEDDSGEDVPRKRARTGSRRAAIVSDEDDDRNSVDDVANPPRAQKQTSEEGSDSDSDDEPVPSRPMSLAERLQLNRIQNPVSGSDDESSSSAVPSIRDYGDFQDDDQSVDTGDPGSEEEALSEDALIDGQAEESDDDSW
ncbi:hypothetical protein UCRPA7_3594 [Phaeoacremonium minimum UCRPA7]|uniref:Uncharacterized protein n=1 Tax=Phaeoacremonium minimum (strain UCR-PA7) TaxID=1286976 RepID=R8BNH8_PHAM7|nr:hypothetical protein UCRPA7_3594 [Phaeoacremonium minimum UCRPA7]EOO00891.1 hypothetical protein UCRPA7_3594 [Phaeoacremonium minimum UCRPA7]